MTNFNIERHIKNTKWVTSSARVASIKSTEQELVSKSVSDKARQKSDKNVQCKNINKNAITNIESCWNFKSSKIRGSAEKNYKPSARGPCLVPALLPM